jgi:glycosyltransferase involved in cell wall biosynthesis
LKVAVIFHRFGPYHFARLEGASRRCEVVGIELGAETGEYQWAKVAKSAGFQWITLFPEGDSRVSPTRELENRMRNALSASRPDVVAIPGWSEKGALFALQWCVENKVPVVLMSESTATDEPRVWWKESVKRRIVALCSSALVGGERHRDYLADLGMPRDRVFTGYDAVDNDYFADARERVIGDRLLVNRRELGLPENYFLASARFIPKKNLDTLIRAYAEYRQKSQVRSSPRRIRPLADQKSEVGSQRSEVGGQRSEVWELVLLGDGPLRSDLRSLISDLGLDDFVVMPGFKQYDELPAYYALAKAFVHPSKSEQWGLVVNEALASGLPVLVSERCGCSPELVQDGINGFTFDPDDQSQLTSRLIEMASLSAEERDRMGEAGREIIKEFGPESFGEGLERSARLAGSQPRKHLGAMDRLILNRMLFR